MSAIILSRGRNGRGAVVVERQLAGRRRRRGAVGPNPQNQLVLARPSGQLTITRPVTTLPVTTRNRNARRRVPNGVTRSAPASFGSWQLGGAPSFQPGNNGRGSMRVAHTEVVADVTGSSTFVGAVVALVPAYFPWLDGISRCFSRFRWTSLQLRYVSNAPTSESGSVATGVVYDYHEVTTPPTSVGDIMSLAHSSLSPVWSPPGLSEGRTVLDCSRWSKPWYSIHDLDDLAVADSFVPAWLVIGVQTGTSGQTCGRIVAEYSIEFLDPVPASLQVVQTNRGKLSYKIGTQSVPDVSTEDRLVEAIERISRLAIAAPHPSPVTTRPPSPRPSG
nr:MAG: putative coat protein [Barnaviridae sp.]